MTHGVMHRLLARPRISIVTSHPDPEVARLRALLGDHLEVDGRWAFERVFGELIEARGELTPATKTLDLIGHSMPDGLLRLGNWVLDGDSPTVTAFFRGIADLEILPRLGVTALRVLGCSTAVTTRARATLKILSELLGLEVFGTVGPIYGLHYDADGFSHQWRFLLSAASESPKPVVIDAPVQLATRRSLDVDALPIVPIASSGDRPRCLVHGEIAREILSVIDRSRGAQMPGLLAIPSHELALATHDAARCHIAEVILHGHFVRVYPDGASEPGIVYPVNDPRRLLGLARSLPTV